MTDRGSTCSSIWSARLLSVLRIVTALLFLQHGSQKLFGIPGNGQPPPGFSWLSLMGVAGELECFGGLLLLVGLFTRPAAFILSGEMAVAYFMAHASRGISPVVNHGELAVLYCFVFLYLVFAGGGSWSVDHCCRCGRQPTKPGATAAPGPPEAA